MHSPVDFREVNYESVMTPVFRSRSKPSCSLESDFVVVVRLTDFLSCLLLLRAGCTTPFAFIQEVGLTH